MEPRHKRRQGRMVPLSELAPPRGGPAELYRIVRRARVAEVLGPALGAYLLEVRVRQEQIVLVFEGEEWRKALSTSFDQVRPRVEALLGRPGVRVTIEFQPRKRGEAKPARPVLRESTASPQDPVERLRALARRLLKRRNQ